MKLERPNGGNMLENLNTIVTKTLKTTEEATNFIVDQIGTVRKHLQNQPPPDTDEITSMKFVKWERRYLIDYGQAMGMIRFAQAFGHIPVELFKDLKNRLIGTVLRKTADVQAGNK
jgi:hypothetical protein